MSTTQTLSLVSQSTHWGTPAVWPGGPSYLKFHLKAFEKLTIQHLLETAATSKLSQPKIKSIRNYFDLPGIAFSFISTKYLSSSNSLALCIWSSMGPVQYIWLKWIKSCVLLNWHHEGHMLTKAIHAPCYRVLQRSNKTIVSNVCRWGQRSADNLVSKRGNDTTQMRKLFTCCSTCWI